MKNREGSYEDEIDRMYARAQRKKNPQHTTPVSRPQGHRRAKAYEKEDDFEIEDLNMPHRRKNTRGYVHKKRKHRKTKFCMWILFFVALVGGLFLFKKSREDGYWTIAVYGVDSRDGNVGKGALADVQILCSINRKTGEIRLASVFRDTYLKIDQEGNYNKINAAYLLGGREQAGEALKENLDLHIEDYATFNWKSIAEAINILGGIDLEITEKEFAYINSFITETVESTGVASTHLEHGGMNHLDGVQAVAYARLRLMDTDFNRTERQRKVLGLAMEKAKQADFNTLRILVGTVFPQISTSVGVDDLLVMAKDVKKYYIGQTSGFPFSHSEMNIGKKDCVIPTTLESNVIQLHAFLYDDTQFTPSWTVKNISKKIAEDSGLYEPGKDTESGKNVGAEGNMGNNPDTAEKATQNGQKPPEGSSSDPQGDPIESKGSDPEDGQNEPSKESPEEMPEPVENEDSENEDAPPLTTAPSESNEPTSIEENQIPETNPGPGGNPPGGNLPDEKTNGPVSGPGGADVPAGDGGGPGTHPSGQPSGQPNAVLEGPGQNAQ